MAAVFDTFADNQLIELIKHGSVGVIPTDTVYGLVCQASHETAVKRLYGLKERKGKPGTIIAANIDQLADLGLKPRYLKAVEQLWPGALSILIPSTDKTTDYLRQGLPAIAVRIPDNKKLVAFLAKTGALLTTSANEPGKEPATSIEQAGIYFGGQVDFYVDGGKLKDRQASTLIRVVDDEIEVLRQGAVKIKDNKVVK